MDKPKTSSARLKLAGTDGTHYYSWDLEPGVFTLGRNSDCFFYVPDRTISRAHAKIEVDDNYLCWLTDLGSHNGSMVNNVKVVNRLALKEGDAVNFGQAEFKIVNVEESSSAFTNPTATRLSEVELEKSVYLSIDEALKPPTTRPEEMPDLFPVFSEMARMLVLHEPKENMLHRSLELIARVIPTNRLAVLVKSENSDEIITAASLVSKGKSGDSLNLSRTIIDDILKEKQAILIANPKTDPRYREHVSIIISEMKSAMAVPIFDEGEVHGILYADTTNPLHLYTDTHLRLMATFGNIIASRLQNYHLAEQREERKILDAELKRASAIQKRLLVTKMPDNNNYSLTAYQDQCRAVGGDLFDVTTLPDGRIIFLVADVSGKGMGAALLMTNILASFRILFGEPEFDLLRAVTQVNRQLFGFSDAGDFATLFVGLINTEKHELEYINAGHNPPMKISENGRIELLEPGGIMIGAFDLMEWEVKKIAMTKGDLILLFTDGVTEAEGAEEQYGEQRLTDFLVANRAKNPERIRDELVLEIERFTQDTPQSDDITMLLVKRTN